MDTRIKEFFKNVIIDEKDVSRANQFLESKGIEKHIILKEKLLNWIEGDKIDCSIIASTYRYDKRLRYCLFKYISYLEEYYRGIILDNYRFNLKGIRWIKEVYEKLIEYKNDLNDVLEHIDFYTLISQVKRIPRKLRETIFPKNKNNSNNLYALKELRNAVMHNKFLLLYRGFEICYVDGVDDGRSGSLKANILNLMQFLPIEVANKCKKEINEARLSGDDNGTKWNLPSAVVIEL